MPPIKNPIFFVIGATGTGKSQVAVLFAQELKANHGYEDVVIVNCDVYQCFNALPISTNKPSVEEFGNVPHAFLGILESNGALSNAAFCPTPEATAAHAAASQALKNAGSFNVHAYEEMVTSFISAYFAHHDNAALIVCGGTCYYIQALLFSNSLVRDNNISSSDGEGEGSEVDEQLWERLNAIDADIASRYHPNDTRRIKRMIEIHRNTGQKPSEIFAQRRAELRFDSRSVFIVWTRMERVTLRLSLDRRVDDMVRRGMLEEIWGFWSSFNGVLPLTSLSEAIGCKEFVSFFARHNSANITGEERKSAIEQVKSNTRRYARQQERWINNRLIRLLQLTPLKESWTHFVEFRTDQRSDVLSLVRATLQVFFATDSMCSTGELVFPLQEAAPVQNPVCQEKCGVCGVLVYGRGQMEAHLKSKRHRGALRRLALEQEQRELYGRELPPSRKKRAA